MGKRYVTEAVCVKPPGAPTAFDFCISAGYNPRNEEVPIWNP